MKPRPDRGLGAQPQAVLMLRRAGFTLKAAAAQLGTSSDELRKWYRRYFQQPWREDPDRIPADFERRAWLRASAQHERLEGASRFLDLSPATLSQRFSAITGRQWERAPTPAPTDLDRLRERVQTSLRNPQDPRYRFYRRREARRLRRSGLRLREIGTVLGCSESMASRILRGKA